MPPGAQHLLGHCIREINKDHILGPLRGHQPQNILAQVPEGIDQYQASQLHRLLRDMLNKRALSLTRLSHNQSMKGKKFRGQREGQTIAGVL